MQHSFRCRSGTAAFAEVVTPGDQIKLNVPPVAGVKQMLQYFVKFLVRKLAPLRKTDNLP